MLEDVVGDAAEEGGDAGEAAGARDDQGGVEREAANDRGWVTLDESRLAPHAIEGSISV